MGHLRIARVAVQSFFVRHREKHASLNTFPLEKRLLITLSHQMHLKAMPKERVRSFSTSTQCSLSKKSISETLIFL